MQGLKRKHANYAKYFRDEISWQLSKR